VQAKNITYKILVNKNKTLLNDGYHISQIVEENSIGDLDKMKSSSSVSAQENPFENQNLVEIFDAIFSKSLLTKNVVNIMAIC
jgi:hypothetical protein